MHNYYVGMGICPKGSVHFVWAENKMLLFSLKHSTLSLLRLLGYSVINKIISFSLNICFYYWTSATFLWFIDYNSVDNIWWAHNENIMFFSFLLIMPRILFQTCFVISLSMVLLWPIIHRGWIINHLYSLFCIIYTLLV